MTMLDEPETYVQVVREFLSRSLGMSTIILG